MYFHKGVESVLGVRKRWEHLPLGLPVDYREKLPSHVSVEVLEHKHGNKALPAHKPLGST